MVKKMNKYGVEVILYYPDSIAFGNIKNYQSIFDHVLLYDNTPKADIKYSIEDDQKTTYLSNGINDGMSVALEEGIKWADNNNIDFLLTMDQDSDLAIEDAKRIQQRISENDEEKVAIYSINYRKIVYKEKKPILLEARYKQGKDIDVNFSMTSGSFVRIKAVKKLLPLDNLFIGFVDNDLCYGLREKGYQIRLVSDVIFNQRVGEPIEDKLFNRLLHRLILTEDRY